MHVAIQWSDGERVSARSWADLLVTLSKDRFAPDTLSIRKDLAKRAYGWSGEIVDESLPPAMFFRALHDAGLLKIVDVDAEPKIK